MAFATPERVQGSEVARAWTRPRYPDASVLSRSGGALRVLERAAIVLALVLSSGRYGTLLGGEGQGFDAPQVLLMALYALGLVSVVVRPIGSLQLIRRSLPLWLLVLFALLSAFWSGDMPLTAVRGLGLLGAALFGIYIANRFDVREIERILLWSFACIVLLNIAVALVLPGHGVMKGWHAGSWQGLYSQKNHLGRISVLATLAFLLLGVRQARYFPRKVLYLAYGFLALFTLYKANSATGLVVLAGVATILLIVALVRKGRRAFMLMGLGLISALFWIGVDTPSVVDVPIESLGRDATLSGRTEVWAAAMDMLALRPVVGYGFGGFWTGWDGPAGYVWAKASWTPADSHNGYLDTLLDLGVVGLILVILAVCSCIYLILAGGLEERSGMEWWILAFMLYFLAYNITESSLLRPTNILWILFVMSYGLLVSGKVFASRRPASSREHLAHAL